jgi:hypothetical protein
MVPDETRKRRRFFFSMTTLIVGMQNLVLVLETSMSVMAILEALIMENCGIVQQKDLPKCLDGVAVYSTNPQNVIVLAWLTAQQTFY